MMRTGNERGHRKLRAAAAEGGCPLQDKQRLPAFFSRCLCARMATARGSRRRRDQRRLYLAENLRDLALDVDEIRAWFERGAAEDSTIVLVCTADEAAGVIDNLVLGARRCYISDEELERVAAEHGASQDEVIAAVLPDRGSVMAGDFGEILTFLYLGSDSIAVVGPKKWRLKQDRRKPAPYSDVVQFVAPAWPTPSGDDRVVCAEVKTKSTNGASTPIASAIEDSTKDSLGRLAKTLVWLKERALTHNLGSTSRELITRFIEATDHPQAQKEFWAVAVVSDDLLANELESAPEEWPDDLRVAVIAVPNLKDRYENVFDAIRASVAEA